MSIAALFIKAKPWKQLACPSTDEWIRKIQCTCIREYYSAPKKEGNDDICSIMNIPGDYQSSEVSQTEKDKNKFINRKELTGIEKRLAVAKAGEGEGRGEAWVGSLRSAGANDYIQDR